MIYCQEMIHLQTLEWRRKLISTRRQLITNASWDRSIFHPSSENPTGSGQKYYVGFTSKLEGKHSKRRNPISNTQSKTEGANYLASNCPTEFTLLSVTTSYHSKVNLVGPLYVEKEADAEHLYVFNIGFSVSLFRRMLMFQNQQACLFLSVNLKCQ